jgi:hypothetical protein
MNQHIIEVDESVERALRQEALHGRHDLLGDLRGGIHARQVIAEINLDKSIKALGQQTWTNDDFEMRLEAVVHGEGFHALALKEGTYDCWDTNQSDMLEFYQRRNPELRINHKSPRTMISLAGKYTPPRS